MIHTDRLTRLFLALASIDNPSRQEAAVSTYIKNQLDELGIPYIADSEATTVAALKDNFNALLAALRTAGLMAAAPEGEDA